MMKYCLVSSARVCRTSTILCALLCLAAALLVACGGKEASPSNGLDLAVVGQTITKVRTTGNEVVVLEERLTSIFEDGPQRTLAIVQSDGHTVLPYTPPSGWSLDDFAVHPSGDISAILTTATDVRIVRLDPTGSIRSDQLFLDPSSPTDPFFNYAGGIKNDNALQPAWRTLVEPGSSILQVSITSGSFDVFGQLQNHLRIFVDVDAGTPATLAVGVVNTPFANFTFRAHSEYFAEPIAASTGALLTRVASSDGRRMGSTVIDTHDLAELHGVRATPGGFVLVGRVLSEVRSDGSGWNAFAAFVGRDGAPGPYSVVDVDRGDVLFDAAVLPGGRYLALGNTGYLQNPSGASISEAAQPLLALLNSDGSLVQNLGYTGGPRHNQLTTIASRNGRWLLGGMINGPGTHSGDADRKLIVADGFLREGSNLPTQ